MDLAQRHLGPIFEHIVVLLSRSPEQLEIFEAWAASQMNRLHHSARHGPAALSFEAELLREDLMLLAPPEDFDAMLTERTERMRLCQRQWLTGLLDFVDDLLDAKDTQPLARAA
ncbi:MAG: hypothetical protein JNM17_05275 [Archangium sp.]|nr:hypothetical protein [Archangium sp.]